VRHTIGLAAFACGHQVIMSAKADLLSHRSVHACGRGRLVVACSYNARQAMPCATSSALRGKHVR